jgi:hypothetical protein
VSSPGERKELGPLEKAKIFVEILAIVFVGGWALIEYGLKEAEERRQGRDTRRISVSLTAKAGKADPQHHLALGQLKLRNDSKRSVRTFLTSWWWIGLEPDGTQFVSTVENSDIHYDLAPGEESLVPHSFVIPIERKVVILHAHVFLNGDLDGLECQLANTPPAGGVAAMDSQPRVCTGLKGRRGCTQKGCPSQQAEELLVLSPEKSEKEVAK